MSFTRFYSKQGKEMVKKYREHAVQKFGSKFFSKK